MKYYLGLAGVLLLGDYFYRIKLYEKETMRKNIVQVKKSKLISFLSPKKESKTYKDLQNLIKKARLNWPIESYMLITIFCFFATMMLGSGILWTNQMIKENEVFHKKSIQINFVSYSKAAKNDDVFLNKLTRKADEQISYKELIEQKKYKELQHQVYYMVKEEGLDGEYTLKYAKKVYENLIYLYENRWTYKHVLMILLFSLSSMLLPKVFLKARARHTEGLMDVELNKLEILTLLLLKKEDVNIYKILLKLKDKSEVFKPYLTRCVNNFPQNGRKAMETMQREVNYQPFTDFINILKQGIDTNKRVTANVLEMTRRLRNNIHRSILKEKNQKKNRNILLIRFPMIVVGLYLLILPWIIIFKESF